MSGSGSAVNRMKWGSGWLIRQAAAEGNSLTEQGCGSAAAASSENTPEQPQQMP